ncbi:hypothetical protein DWB85_08945 [Seongchinamella sediminis]|uniref:Uncharacterized protein n=1 Tax=Seongchinamella sediminis TaxID=2283635 RepID=A0A3L7DZG5_9GAMM|nr:hypothetical protein DWB85_08945 [Seongchinamella sediminis]
MITLFVDKLSIIYGESVGRLLQAAVDLGSPDRQGRQQQRLHRKPGKRQNGSRTGPKKYPRLH